MDQNALLEITQGLYILGVKDTAQNRFAGCIIDAVSQVAMDPDMLIISSMNKNYTRTLLDTNTPISLSILPDNTPAEIISAMGYQSGKDTDKWKSVPFMVKENLPVYQDAIAYITGHIVDQKQLSSHTVFFVQVDDAAYVKKNVPLTYNHYRQKLKDQICTPSSTLKTEKWVCDVCAYVYNGSDPFENLPDDWKCPVCGVGKECFTKQICTKE